MLFSRTSIAEGGAAARCVHLRAVASGRRHGSSVMVQMKSFGAALSAKEAAPETLVGVVSIRRRVTSSAHRHPREVVADTGPPRDHQCAMNIMLNPILGNH